MDIEYTVTETIHRNPSGGILKIEFHFDECITMIAEPTRSGLVRHNREKRFRSNEWCITRNQYQTLMSNLYAPLDFDTCLAAIRPIVFGHYRANELERAFNILDRDKSNTLSIQELGAILPILNDSIDANALHKYIKEVDQNFDGELTFDEFRSFVLRGLGRDIMCSHF